MERRERGRKKAGRNGGRKEEDRERRVEGGRKKRERDRDGGWKKAGRRKGRRLGGRGGESKEDGREGRWE